MPASRTSRRRRRSSPRPRRPARSRSTTATRPRPGCRSCGRRSPTRPRATAASRSRRRRCSSPTAASRPSTRRSRPCSTRATRCCCPRRTGPPTRRRSGSPAACPVDVVTTEDAGYLPTVEQLEAARTERTKVLLWCSPSNPTGAVAPRALVEAVGRWAVEHGVWVVADEIYEHLVYGDAEHVSMPVAVPELQDTCVVVNGVAKTYAMTGWRVGWLIGPADVVKGASNLQSHATSNVSNVAQVAALEAVSGDLDGGRARCGPPSTAAGRRWSRCSTRSTASPAPSRRAPSTPTRRSRACSARRSAGSGRRPAPSWPSCCSTRSASRSCPARRSARPGYFRLSYALGDDDLVKGVTPHPGAAGARPASPSAQPARWRAARRPAPPRPPAGPPRTRRPSGARSG